MTVEAALRHYERDMGFKIQIPAKSVAGIDQADAQAGVFIFYDPQCSTHADPVRSAQWRPVTNELGRDEHCTLYWAGLCGGRLRQRL